MEELDQIRAQLALARAFGLACYHRAFPVKSAPVTVPTTRADRTVRDACGSRAPATPFADVPIVVIDTETSGLDPATDRVIEIAFVSSTGGAFVSLVNPGVPIPPDATAVHGIGDADVADAPSFAEAWDEAKRRGLLDGHPLAFHAPFDTSMIAAELVRAGRTEEAQALVDLEWLDGCVVIKDQDRFEKGKRLVDACARRGIFIEAHRAMGDAIATLALWNATQAQWCSAGGGTLAGVLRLTKERRAAQEADFAAWQAKQARKGRAA